MEGSNMLLSGDLNKIYSEVNKVAEAIMVHVNELKDEVAEIRKGSEKETKPAVKKKVDKAA
jgi:hypothetical protein|tara:strand:+ start:322 stop:504 length:183 start_codon:yes stop_codon:yes gene_type:complete